MLERADLILYAGSLVPKALTDCHKPRAVVRSSADMTLEEQCQLMKEHYDKGHYIVRLHTGDPCIFGAIQEQMAFFDREGMTYHITPGISSLPGRCCRIAVAVHRSRAYLDHHPHPRRGAQPHARAGAAAPAGPQPVHHVHIPLAATVDDVQRELLQE